MTHGTRRMLVIWLVGGAVAGGGFVLEWFDPLVCAMIATVSATLGIEVRAITERAARRSTTSL